MCVCGVHPAHAHSPDSTPAATGHYAHVCVFVRVSVNVFVRVCVCTLRMLTHPTAHPQPQASLTPQLIVQLPPPPQGPTAPPPPTTRAARAPALLLTLTARC